MPLGSVDRNAPSVYVRQMQTSTKTTKHTPRRDPYTAVLDAAAAILAEGGYGAFTIEAVAKRSGAGKTTVYRRWPTKAELFTELYNRESAALLAVSDMGSLRAELTTEITRIWQFWRKTANGPAFRALIAEAQADPATMVLYRDHFLPGRRIFARKIIERAIARGEIDPAVDIEVALDMLFGFTIYHLISDDLSKKSNHIKQVVEFFYRGMSASAGRRPQR
jgi:AcrR family transcriptional regulator